MVPADDGEAAVVGEAGADDGGEHGLLQERVFVQHDAVEVHAAHPLVGRHAAVELDDRAVVGEDDGQLAFEEAHAVDGGGVLLEVGPDEVLGLLERRADVAVARRRPLPAVEVGGADQVVGQRHGFPGPPVGADEDPAFLGCVQGEEVAARPVGDDQRRVCAAGVVVSVALRVGEGH